MIKATDLRIGNIIWHTRKNVDTNEIEDIETVVDGNLIKSLELHPYLGYNPIPLTPEVLEKAGFILMNRVTQRFKKYINETDSECICLELSEVGNNKPYRVMYDYNAGTYLKRKVPYLHDLQNLYHSLTGTELTLNICTATTQNGDL